MAKGPGTAAVTDDATPMAAARRGILRRLTAAIGGTPSLGRGRADDALVVLGAARAEARGMLAAAGSPWGAAVTTRRDPDGREEAVLTMPGGGASIRAATRLAGGSTQAVTTWTGENPGNPAECRSWLIGVTWVSDLSWRDAGRESRRAMAARAEMMAEIRAALAADHARLIARMLDEARA